MGEQQEQGVVVSRCEQDGVGRVNVRNTAARPSSLPSGLALNVCKDCEGHIQALFQQEGAVRG